MTTAGLIVGLGAIAVGIGAPDCSDADGGDLYGMGYGIGMLVLGAGTGYITWGVIDTLVNAHTPAPTRATTSGGTFVIVPAVAPLFVASDKPNKPPVLDGLTIGATATF
jgi:hypothetical protein